jgi:hypothetical protein
MREGREESTKIFILFLNGIGGISQKLTPHFILCCVMCSLCHVRVLIVVDKRNPHGWNYLYLLGCLAK